MTFSSSDVLAEQASRVAVRAGVVAGLDNTLRELTPRGGANETHAGGSACEFSSDIRNEMVLRGCRPRSRSMSASSRQCAFPTSASVFPCRLEVSFLKPKTGRSPRRRGITVPRTGRPALGDHPRARCGSIRRLRHSSYPRPAPTSARGVESLAPACRCTCGGDASPSARAALMRSRPVHLDHSAAASLRDRSRGRSPPLRSTAALDAVSNRFPSPPGEIHAPNGRACTARELLVGGVRARRVDQLRGHAERAVGHRLCTMPLIADLPPLSSRCSLRPMTWTAACGARNERRWARPPRGEDAGLVAWSSLRDIESACPRQLFFIAATASHRLCLAHDLRVRPA